MESNRAPVPGIGALHQRVQDAVRELIQTGSYLPGDRLPSERELCERFGASRLTVRRALGQLANAGHVQSVQGRGWFVSSQPSVSDGTGGLQSLSAAARAHGFSVTASVLGAVVRPADFDEADVLGMVAGSDLFDLERVRFLDGIRLAADRMRIPLSVAPRLPSFDFQSASLHSALEEQGVVIARAEEQISVLDADATLAELLEVQVGKGLLHSAGVLFDQHGRATCLTWAAYRPDRYRFSSVVTRYSRIAGGPPTRLGGRSWPPVAHAIGATGSASRMPQPDAQPEPS